MKGWLVGTVVVAFVATTAFAQQSGGRRGGGGGRSGGGHSSGGAVRSSGGARSGGHASGGQAQGRVYRSGAESRHPVAGTGHGYRYYGNGHYGNHYYGNRYYGGYYGRGYYGRGYYPYYGSYGYYPYYGSYGSYPYGGYWGSGLSIGLSYDSGYAYSAPAYPAYAGSYPAYGSYGANSSYAEGPPPQDENPPPAGRYESREDQRVRGELRLTVQPDDASVYVDDRFLGTARQVQTLSLAPGPHRIQVVRPGFQTVERTVQVRPDAPATVVVELDRQ